MISGRSLASPRLWPGSPPEPPHPLVSCPGKHRSTARVLLDNSASPGGWGGGLTPPPPLRDTRPPEVVKQDKSSGGSVDTTQTRSGPQRVRMSSGERPMGAAKGKQSDTEALCQPPPHPRHGEDSLHCPPRRTFGGSTGPRTQEKGNAQLSHIDTCPPTHCTPNGRPQLR